MRLGARTILLCVTASLALVASLILATAPGALAGTYTVYGCQTATGAAAPLSGWTDVLAVYPAYWKSTCPGPVYMWMAASSAHGFGRYAQETFVAPDGTTIQKYTLVRAVRLVPSGGYYYQALQETAGFWTKVDGCDTYTNCQDFGDYKNESSNSNDFTHTTRTAATAVQLRVTCGMSGGCPAESGGVSASVWLFQSRITLEDSAAPQFVGPPSGPLVSGGALAGVVPVSIGATDQGGGVYQGEIEVDGHVVQSQVLDNSTGTCQQPFVAARPCPLSANGTLDVNTAALADGTHSLRVLVTDAAGNTAAWGPVTITTVNSPCSPFPDAAGMTMQASFAKRIHKRTHFFGHLTAAYADRPVIDGALTAAGGAPVGNAPICVAVRFDQAGAQLRGVKSFTTSPGGRFAYRIGHGPSRTIYFIHRVPGGAIWHAVHISVHAPVKVHVNAHRLRNGQTMVWKGRLAGPIPGGMLALMQVWRGTYWETFQQIHIARNGKWAGRYRFAFTTGIQHYSFRLSVPRQSGYPYASGVSGHIKMVVRG